MTPLYHVQYTFASCSNGGFRRASKMLCGIEFFVRQVRLLMFSTILWTTQINHSEEPDCCGFFFPSKMCKHKHQTSACHLTKTKGKEKPRLPSPLWKQRRAQLHSTQGAASQQRGWEAVRLHFTPGSAPIFWVAWDTHLSLKFYKTV